MTRNSPAAPLAAAAMASFFPEEEQLLPGLTLRFARPPADASACLALLDLTLLAEVLARPRAHRIATSLLSPAEQERYATLTYPKRRHEWLGGRLACKAAVLRLTPPPAPVAMNGLSIAAAANGAPLLSCPSLPDWELPAISISHSGGYAVAMAGHARRCGIDLQQISVQTQRVVDRFALPGEVDLLRQRLPALAETERLTLLWAAKEAVKKGLLRDQPPVFQGVVLQSVACNDDVALRLSYPGDGDRPAAIRAVALADYFLAYTGAWPHA